MSIFREMTGPLPAKVSYPGNPGVLAKLTQAHLVIVNGWDMPWTLPYLPDGNPNGAPAVRCAGKVSGGDGIIRASIGLCSQVEGNMFRIQLLFVAAIAISFGQDKTPRKLIASMDGKDLYVSYCASCHGTDGKGHGPVAVALKDPLPDLTKIAKRHGGKFPGEEMEKMILGAKGSRVAHGSEDMPVWGPVFRKVENDQDLGLVRVRRLVEYLTSMQSK